MCRLTCADVVVIEEVLVVVLLLLLLGRRCLDAEEMGHAVHQAFENAIMFLYHARRFAVFGSFGREARAGSCCRCCRRVAPGVAPCDIGSVSCGGEGGSLGGSSC